MKVIGTGLQRCGAKIVQMASLYSQQVSEDMWGVHEENGTGLNA